MSVTGLTAGDLSGALSIESEIGRLRTVVVHSPGAEIESMTPGTARRVLYNAIIPLSVVRDEHRLLKEVLSRVATVHEVTDLLADALEDESERDRLLAELAPAAPQLAALEPAQLVSALVRGVPAPQDSLTAVLSGPQHLLPPLPNLYFMRDSSCVVGASVIVGAMAHPVRSGEASMLGSIFSRSGRTLFDGVAERERDDRIRLEGGDMLVARRDLLVVGVSERTSSEALDRLGRRLCALRKEPLTMIAAVLPGERSTIHLDMIFTLVDETMALIYEPYVTGRNRSRVFTMRLKPGRAQASPNPEDVRVNVSEADGLLEAIRGEGLDLEPLVCGGTDQTVRSREQWLSAANVFAVAPGKVLGYDCNSATMESFARAGYTTVSAQDFLAGGYDPDAPGRLFVGIPGINLARGGGGPRCMTLPLTRDPVPTLPR